ncbi:MAG: hypothetical protein ACK4JD_12535 [Thermoflexales bacterium]
MTARATSPGQGRVAQQVAASAAKLLIGAASLTATVGGGAWLAAQQTKFDEFAQPAKDTAFDGTTGSASAAQTWEVETLVAAEPLPTVQPPAPAPVLVVLEPLPTVAPLRRVQAPTAAAKPSAAAPRRPAVNPAPAIAQQAPPPQAQPAVAPAPQPVLRRVQAPPPPPAPPPRPVARSRSSR